MRVAILGAGGVGATVAGALNHDPNMELILIARGETKRLTRERGWILESEKLGNQVIHPALISEDPTEIGTVDVLILACKSFSVPEVCERYRDVVREDTLVIPLQNGVQTTAQAEAALGRGQIAHGLIYCLSQSTEKGKVVNMGELLRAAFGFPDGRKSERAEALAAGMRKGGLPTVYTADILQMVWEKFMMICGNSCAFLYYDCPSGGITADQRRMQFLKGTYEDILRLAAREGVVLPEDIVARYLQEFAQMPPTATSSLYRDIRDKVPNNELEQIVGNAVRMARKNGIQIPFVAAAYDKTLQTKLW